MNFITKNELLTRDVDTLDSQIVYQVSRPPVHGQLENVDHPRVVIMFFTQGTILLFPPFSLSVYPQSPFRSPSIAPSLLSSISLHTYPSSISLHLPPSLHLSQTLSFPSPPSHLIKLLDHSFPDSFSP